MKKPYLIGLTGGSGSGKTTFIRQLEKAFGAEEMCVISQDNYYRSREEQVQDENGIKNFDLPNSIDHQAFAADLKVLLSGQTVRRQEYTFNNPLATPGIIELKPCPIILVEGIFVMHYPDTANLLDLKIYLHAREATAFARRIKRDQMERNYPLEDVLYRYEKHVLPTYEQFILPLQYKADLVINNNHHFDKGLEVLIGFLKQRLEQP